MVCSLYYTHANTAAPNMSGLLEAIAEEEA